MYDKRIHKPTKHSNNRDRMTTPLRLITIAFAMSVTNSHADISDGRKSNALEVMTVTASRVEQPLGREISSLSVVGNDELTNVAPVHPSELLVQVPGTWVSRGNGQESLIAIRSPVLTGAGSCGAFDITLDGVATRGIGFCNVNQLFDLNIEQAGRVEVLRGLGNELHSSNALHGIINVVSKAPSGDQSQQLTLEGGPNDYGRLLYTASNTMGAHGFRVSVNGASDNGEKDNSGYDQQKISLRHDYSSDSLKIKNLFNVTNLNQETAGYVETLDPNAPGFGSGREAYKEASNQRYNPNPEAYRNSYSVQLQNRIEKRFKNNSTLVITPYARRTSMEFMMHFLPGTPVEKNSQTGAGLQTSFTQNISDRHQLTTGFDMEYTSAWLQQTQDGGFSSFPAGKQYDYQVDAIVAAAFVSSDYTLSPSTQLSTGLRWQYLEYDYNNQMADGGLAEDGSHCINGFTGNVGCRYFRPSDRKDSFSNGTVNIGVLHDLRDNLTLTGRLAHGFRAPQATELYRLQSGQSVANINSEKINSIELGVRAQHKQLRYQLTSFYMEKDNVIFQNANRQNIDNGATQHYGLEYDVFWSFADNWDITLVGTYAIHQYTKNTSTPGGSIGIISRGNAVDTAPRTMGSAQLGWSFANNSRAELEWVHMGRYYTNISNTRHYNGHDLLNLRLHHQFSERITGGLRVKNLLNDTYAERADVTFGSSDNRYFIGEPRSVFVSASFNW